MSAWALLLVGWISAVPAPGWTAAGSPHFEMLIHAEAGTARALLEHLERAAAVLESRGAGTLAGRRLQVLVFASQEEYAAIRLAPYAAGHYVASGDRALMVISRPDPQLLTHELVHAMLPRYRNIPKWWEEGMAEYYSTMRFEDQRVILGETAASRVRALRVSGLAPLHLIRADEPSTENALAFYRGSWAMAHVLLSSGLTGIPPANRWPSLHAQAAAQARRGRWATQVLPAPAIDTTGIYSSLQRPRAISVSAAMAPNAFQAGSWATFVNNGQALRKLPSTK